MSHYTWQQPHKPPSASSRVDSAAAEANHLSLQSYCWTERRHLSAHLGQLCLQMAKQHYVTLPGLSTREQSPLTFHQGRAQRRGSSLGAGGDARSPPRALLAS